MDSLNSSRNPTGNRIDLSLEEWKEARRSVGRFDEHLLNLRRYGFTLATIMIGGDAYLSATVDTLPWAKAGAAIAVMMLIYALFLLDGHVHSKQLIAVNRAMGLEKEELGMKLTTDRMYAERWFIHSGSTSYIFFLLATGTVGLISVLATAIGPREEYLHRWLPLAGVVLLCLTLICLTWISRGKAWKLPRVVGRLRYVHHIVGRQSVEEERQHTT